LFNEYFFLYTIYVVLSRDTSFVYCTTDIQKAESAKEERIIDEEMRGGRPSVYIKETILRR